MGKSINVSDAAYEWLLKETSKETTKQNKNVSIAEIVDRLIKEG